MVIQNHVLTIYTILIGHSHLIPQCIETNLRHKQFRVSSGQISLTLKKEAEFYSEYSVWPSQMYGVKTRKAKIWTGFCNWSVKTCAHIEVFIFYFFWVVELRPGWRAPDISTQVIDLKFQDSNIQVKRLLASSRLSVRMEQIGSHWRVFRKCYIF
jgi:hypothetical protein